MSECNWKLLRQCPTGKSAMVQAGLCLLVKEIRSANERQKPAMLEQPSVLLSLLTSRSLSHLQCLQRMLSDHE